MLFKFLQWFESSAEDATEGAKYDFYQVRLVTKIVHWLVLIVIVMVI